MLIIGTTLSLVTPTLITVLWQSIFVGLLIILIFYIVISLATGRSLVLLAWFANIVVKLWLDLLQHIQRLRKEKQGLL